VVFSQDGTYSLEVLESIESGSWVTSQQPRMTSLLDTLLAHSICTFCAQASLLTRKILRRLHFQTRVWCHPVMRHDSNKCQNGSVEDEFHFLFDCNLYSTPEEKSALMSYCLLLNPAFTNITNVEKWRCISLTTDSHLTYIEHTVTEGSACK